MSQRKTKKKEKKTVHNHNRSSTYSEKIPSKRGLVICTSSNKIDVIINSETYRKNITNNITKAGVDLLWTGAILLPFDETMTTFNKKKKSTIKGKYCIYKAMKLQ